MRRWVAVHLLAAAALLTAACGPDIEVDPAGQGFFDASEQPVDRRIAATYPVDEDCGWEAAMVLELAWPPEDALAGKSTETRFYIRDPQYVVPPELLSAPYDGGSALDFRSVYTGLHTTTFQLWVGEDEDIYIYVVAGSRVEAWPRVQSRPAC